MKKVLISAILGMLTLPSIAQKEAKKPDYNHAISNTITDLFLSKFTLNYEYMGFKNTNYSPGIGLSISSIVRTTYGDDNYDYTRNSTGLEISNKIYTTRLGSDHFNNKVFYINPAFSFENHQFSYLGATWVPFDDNGSTLYNYDEETLLEPTAQSFSFSPQVGIVYNKQHLFLDAYCGISLIKSIIKDNIGNDDLPLPGWGGIGLHNFNFFFGLKTGLCF